MAVKNSQRFAEIERLIGDYFGCHLAPVMGRVQRDLSNRQADEMRAYSNSTAGILRSLATANMPGDDPYATLRITGEWNSKTTEDYLAMCKEAIVGNKDMQRDLAVMAEEWRKAVVTEIGRERYDALSKQLGCDLAYAYIDHRMEQLMIEKLIKRPYAQILCRLYHPQGGTKQSVRSALRTEQVTPCRKDRSQRRGSL